MNADYRQFLNSIVRAHTRVNSRTGNTEQVAEYERNTAYHGTSSANGDSIAKTGIEARTSPNGNGVWASPKKHEAIMWGLQTWAREKFPNQEITEKQLKEHGDDRIAVVHVDKSAFPAEHQNEETLISQTSIPKEKLKKVEYYTVRDAHALDKQASKLEDAEADNRNGIHAKIPKLKYPKPVDEKMVNSNPGHLGRPGQRGGSSPKVELRHYSQAHRDVIDPKFHGTGLAGAEKARKQAYPKLWVDRSYWYLPRTSKEAGVGDALHKTTVPVKSLYDYDRDPEDFYSKAVEQNKGKYAPLDDQAHQNVAEGLIKQAGYTGYTGRIGSGKAAALFYPVKGGQVMKNSIDNNDESCYGSDMKITNTWSDAARQASAEVRKSQAQSNPSNSLSNFGGGLKQNLRQPGWAVITPTQESLGAHDSPENQKQHAKFLKELEARGIEYQPVHGYYKGVDQGKNYLIKADHDTAMELGKKYKQESVLTHNGLVYSDGSGVHASKHEDSKFGKDAEAQDFYSKLPSGESFSMGLDFDKKVPVPARDNDTAKYSKIIQAIREQGRNFSGKGRESSGLRLGKWKLKDGDLVSKELKKHGRDSNRVVGAGE